MRFSCFVLASAFGAALLWPAQGAAQNHPTQSAPESIKLLNGQDLDSAEVAALYKIFQENAPKAFNVPGAPRFAIEGKDKKFYLGIGGNVKATASYDFGSPIQNAFDFTTSAIPMSQPKGNGGLVQMSAATSGMFVNFVAMPGEENQIGAYIDFNLTGGSGDGYGFDLQYAYVKYRGLTAGYNYSLFSDMAAAPPSIDNEGPCGFTAIPNGVVDYTLNIDKNWSVAIGAEMPIASATTGRRTYMVNQRIPDVPAYVQYAWDGGASWIRASAILRNMLYRNVSADENRYVTGWGVKASGSTALCSAVQAYYQAAYGKGITSYFQDLYEGGMDMVPGADGLEAVKAWGGYAGLQYNLSPTVYATTTYSHVRTYAPEYGGMAATPWSQQYKYAQYALANVMWSITPQVQTGIEYIYGRRVNYDGMQAHDNRVQTMIQVTF